MKKYAAFAKHLSVLLEAERPADEIYRMGIIGQFNIRQRTFTTRTLPKNL